MLKMFKKIVIATLVVSMVSPIVAHGKGDVEDLQVSNLNSWQEEFDLDSRKPGKYNIMITAKDLLKDLIILFSIQIQIYQNVVLQTLMKT